MQLELCNNVTVTLNGYYVTFHHHIIEESKYNMKFSSLRILKKKTKIKYENNK